MCLISTITGSGCSTSPTLIEPHARELAELGRAPAAIARAECPSRSSHQPNGSAVGSASNPRSGYLHGRCPNATNWNCKREQPNNSADEDDVLERARLRSTDRDDEPEDPEEEHDQNSHAENPEHFFILRLNARSGPPPRVAILLVEVQQFSDRQRGALLQRARPTTSRYAQRQPAAIGAWLLLGGAGGRS